MEFSNGEESDENDLSVITPFKMNLKYIRNMTTSTPTTSKDVDTPPKKKLKISSTQSNDWDGKNYNRKFQ